MTKDKNTVSHNKIEHVRHRVKWVDVARCFGMFAIYLGHFRPLGGQGAEFVYTHHVALFFFLSGCMENYAADESFKVRLKKIGNTILLPWVFFAMITVIVQTIYSDFPIKLTAELLKVVALGTICDKFVAGGLWFLTCLALMKIIFWAVHRLKNKVAMVIIALLMYFVEAIVELPKYYNFHRCFRFMIFYVIGYISYNAICKFLETKNRNTRFALIGSAIAAFLYSALLFFGKNPLFFMEIIPYCSYVITIVHALVVIWLYIIAAKLTERIDILNDLGRHSLYLCGSEYLVHLFIKSLVRVVGLEIVLERPLNVYIYVGIMMLVALKWFVPLEKKALDRIRKIPKYLKK